MNITIHSSSLFASVYNNVFRSIMKEEYTRFTFTGGRGSCKSSFASLMAVVLIVLNPEYNALIIRRTAKTLRNSVYEQILWAIDALGLRSYFHIPKSQTAALPIIFNREDGKQQKIIFTGCDNPEKIKSIKTSHGYFAVIWVEEKTEFLPALLQNVMISAMRGGKRFCILESFNPPSAPGHWCNKELLIPDEQRLKLHTTYLDIPKEWLGPAILHDIEQMKTYNFRGYENIYLGKATGSGRNVFDNIHLQELKQDFIYSLDYHYHGIDWGFYPDPFAFVAMAYQPKEGILYIYDELYLLRHSNYAAFERLKTHLEKQGKDLSYRITADSAEPKSVADFREWGANLRGAIKGPGSRDAGFKWLQGLKAIVIDPVKCPKVANEFSLYELDINRTTGEVEAGYPAGQDDHGMDAVRYAMENVWRKRGA